MDYKEKYNEALKRATFYNGELLTENQRKMLVDIFPELKEDVDELTWLKSYIKEEVECLSMDIRDTEDSRKLEKLQKSLTWLEKQCEQKTDPCTDCTNDKGCVTCEHGELRETHTRTLDSDKVIEWLVANICNFEYFVKWFKQDFGL